MLKQAYQLWKVFQGYTTAKNYAKLKISLTGNILHKT